jgi:hydrogenase 3 maturation protease
MTASETEGELRKWLAGSASVVVAGIGNTIRCDDGVGITILQALQGKVSQKVTLIECETVPEAFVDDIVAIRPSHVLLVDAAMIGLEPGEMRLCAASEVTDAAVVSSHALPLKVFCEYIIQLTGAKITLLLIQPKDTGFGEQMSSELEVAAAVAAGILQRALP